MRVSVSVSVRFMKPSVCFYSALSSFAERVDDAEIDSTVKRVHGKSDLPVGGILQR